MMRKGVILNESQLIGRSGESLRRCGDRDPSPFGLRMTEGRHNTMSVALIDLVS